MDLRARYIAETALLGGVHVHASLDAFAMFVSKNPWVFGMRSYFEIPDAVAEVLGPPPSRWELLAETSPSGKRLFRCSGCSAATPMPSAQCGLRGCTDTY